MIRAIKKFFKWIVDNVKDKQTRRIFYIVYLVMTSPIWLCYIIGFLSKSVLFIGIATAVVTFWSLPGTPLLAICLALTLGIKKIITKRRNINGEDIN